MTGRSLRSARRRLGLTQAELASVLGLHPNTIARYERGELRTPVVVEAAVRWLLEKAKIS